MPKHGEPHTNMEQTILDNVKSANPHLLDASQTVNVSGTNSGNWTVNVSGTNSGRLFARFEWFQAGHNPFGNNFETELYCLKCGSISVDETSQYNGVDETSYSTKCRDCGNSDFDAC